MLNKFRRVNRWGVLEQAWNTLNLSKDSNRWVRLLALPSWPPSAAGYPLKATERLSPNRRSLCSVVNPGIRPGCFDLRFSQAGPNWSHIFSGRAILKSDFLRPVRIGLRLPRPGRFDVIFSKAGPNWSHIFSGRAVLKSDFLRSVRIGLRLPRPGRFGVWFFQPGLLPFWSQIFSCSVV